MWQHKFSHEFQGSAEHDMLLLLPAAGKILLLELG
jgi:hypothetical protein